MGSEQSAISLSWKVLLCANLKPNNILATADGTPKLLDFGIAKVLGAQEPLGSGGHSNRQSPPDACLGQPGTGSGRACDRCLFVGDEKGNCGLTGFSDIAG